MKRDQLGPSGQLEDKTTATDSSELNLALTTTTHSVTISKNCARASNA